MRRRSALLLLALGALAPSRAWAQQSIKSSITLSALTIAFPSATEADYDQTWVAATSPLTLTFDSKKNAGNQPIADRTSTMSIRASTATLGGTKPIGDLEWQKSGAGTWTPLTMSDVTIESRTFRFNGINDPWAATLLFRTRLYWATTTPATYSTSVIITLTITTP